jgi:hypothetical protein
MIQRYLPDVASPGEKKGSVAFDGFAFGQVAWIPHVTRLAITFKSAFIIDADLRATARDLALVYVWKRKRQIFQPPLNPISPSRLRTNRMKLTFASPVVYQLVAMVTIAIK